MGPRSFMTGEEGEGLKIWWGPLGDIERSRKGIIKKLLVNVGLKIDKNSD